MEQMKKDAAEKLNRILELEEKIGRLQQAIKPLREESSKLQAQYEDDVAILINQANINGALKEKEEQDADYVWKDLESNDVYHNEPLGHSNPLVFADLLLNIADEVSKTHFNATSPEVSKSKKRG